jgi:hypothetical protein
MYLSQLVQDIIWLKCLNLFLLTNLLSVLLFIAFFLLLFKHIDECAPLKGCALQLCRFPIQDGGRFCMLRAAARGVYPYDVYAFISLTQRRWSSDRWARSELQFVHMHQPYYSYRTICLLTGS